LNVSGKGTPSGDPVALAINSASAALVESGLPLLSPAGCVRVCLMIDGEMIIDPSPTQLENSRLDLLYAGSRDRTLMLEFCAKPTEFESSSSAERELIGIPEEEVADIIRFAQGHVLAIIEAQERIPVKIRVGNNDRDLRLRLASDLGIAQRMDDADELRTMEKEAYTSRMQEKLQDAFDYVYETLEDVVLRLFSGTSVSNEAEESDEISLSKFVRGMRENAVREEVKALIFERYHDISEEEQKFLQSSVLKKLMKEGMRRAAIDGNRRSDGRSLKSIRPISMSAPLFPDSVHGSAIFTRGETQVICTATLGAPKEGLPLSTLYSTASEFDPNSFPKVSPVQDLPVGSLRSTKNEMALISDLNSRKIKADREQTGDSGTLDEVQRAFLHYDFPSFSTGEALGPKGPSANRRAIGHGSLAERALLPALPPVSQFPYSLRVTSEVTSSNGSSSMATTSGATLALLDAGVRILAPIAGVSIGLVVDENHRHSTNETDAFSSLKNYAILVDLTGTEDYYGEMDFKVAGSPHGITAMQLDVKYPGGVPIDILIDAMVAAKNAREEIFDAMSDANRGGIADFQPRRGLKTTAPRVEVIRFDPVRKRDLIGPGGAILKQLESHYGVALDLSQEGQCLLHGRDAEMVGKAMAAVMDLVADVEEGGIYEGVVMAVKDFGAVVELLRNKEGLLHVSELTDDEGILNNPEGNLGVVKEMVKVGDKIRVLCIGVDPVEGSIRLSRKRLKDDDLYNYSSAATGPIHEEASRSSDAWRLELIKDANRARNERGSHSAHTSSKKTKTAKSQRRTVSKNTSKGGSRKNSRSRRLRRSKG